MGDISANCVIDTLREAQSGVTTAVLNIGTAAPARADTITIATPVPSIKTALFALCQVGTSFPIAVGCDCTQGTVIKIGSLAASITDGTAAGRLIVWGV